MLLFIINNVIFYVRVEEINSLRQKKNLLALKEHVFDICTRNSKDHLVPQQSILVDYCLIFSVILKYSSTTRSKLNSLFLGHKSLYIKLKKKK